MMNVKHEESKRAAKELSSRWVGRNLAGSTDANPSLGLPAQKPRPVSEVRYNAETEQFVAFADEHHIANTAEALERRLNELAIR